MRKARNGQFTYCIGDRVRDEAGHEAEIVKIENDAIVFVIYPALHSKPIPVFTSQIRRLS